MRLKKLITIIVAIILLALLLVAVAWVRFERTSIVPPSGLTYVLQPGTSVTQLAYDLKKKGTLDSVVFFKLLLRLRHATAKLQAGEYFFPPGSTPNQVINKMLAGEIVHHAFTIVNGWNSYQVLAALESDPYINPSSELIVIK